MEKYATAGQATDDSIVRCIRVACWLNRATDLHSEYVILIAFLRQRMLKRKRLMLRLYVMYCTMPVVLTVGFSELSMFLVYSRQEVCFCLSFEVDFVEGSSNV